MNDLILYAVNILGAGEDDLKRLMYEGISQERREKAERYRFFDDKLRCVAAERLLRFGLKERGINENEINIKYGLHNKPRLYGNQMPFFNISHSGKWVICALSDIEAGCDIEIIKKAEMGVAERFYGKDEYLSLLETPEGDMRDRAFFRYWTRHESYGKYTGEGFTDRVDEDSVVFYEPEINPGYACSVCVGKESVSNGMKEPEIRIRDIWEI